MLQWTSSIADSLFILLLRPFLRRPQCIEIHFKTKARFFLQEKFLKLVNEELKLCIHNSKHRWQQKTPLVSSEQSVYHSCLLSLFVCCQTSISSHSAPLPCGFIHHRRTSGSAAINQSAWLGFYWPELNLKVYSSNPAPPLLTPRNNSLSSGWAPRHSVRGRIEEWLLICQGRTRRERSDQRLWLEMIKDRRYP